MRILAVLFIAYLVPGLVYDGSGWRAVSVGIESDFELHFWRASSKPVESRWQPLAQMIQSSELLAEEITSRIPDFNSTEGSGQ
ncbi:hypothetical protein JJB09_02760 [Rhizobium sp. KVB221]|uniref:Uncharacterized protein n=1 Tax=Rhizobium setariae TaxID=2801340 RepID=A0A936YMN1_9HYPH|nr:hypothetical protein [Rhizobium setariae]MBL0370939.1 hypothetical protein [Rhizobium setariae]